ncbi:MAG: acyl carrier protein [Rhizobacter sp.]|nr:acyl carrier protein [Bacteriovorax sp.]
MDQDLVKIQRIFSEVLNVSADEISMDSNMDNVDEWDSMKHLELIMSIESEFEVSFEVHEIVELNSVEKILEILEEKRL